MYISISALGTYIMCTARSKGEKEVREWGVKTNRRARQTKKATRPCHFVNRKATPGSNRWLEVPWTIVACVCHTYSCRMRALVLILLIRGEEQKLSYPSGQASGRGRDR